jgi:hypothetical protein
LTAERFLYFKEGSSPELRGSRRYIPPLCTRYRG